jgi:phenylacetate-CoA ligase
MTTAIAAHPRSTALQLALQCAAGSTFYRRKFRAAGIAESELSGDGLAACFDKLPTLEPEELIANAQSLRPNGSRAFRVSCSGGSLGSPKTLYRTGPDWDQSVANMARALAISGIGRDDTLLIAQPFGIWSIGHLALDACRHLGCMAIPAGNQQRPENLADLTERFEATAAFATPSLWTSVTECRASRAFARPVRLLLAGEKLLDSTRQALGDAWRGGVCELYGSEETDALAAQCGFARGMHVLEDSFVIELMGEAGPMDHSQPGVHEGELVVTSLYHEGSPLIRYRLGDIVRIHRTISSCACGSSQARIEVIGKSRQFLQLFDATKVYFHQVECAVRGALNRETEIQVILENGPARIEVLSVNIGCGGTSDEQERLKSILANCSLDLADSIDRGQVELRITADKSLKENTPKGKQKQMIDRRNSNQERGH